MLKEKFFLFLILILVIIGFLIYYLPRSFLYEERAKLFVENIRKYPPYIRGIYLTSWTAGDSEKMAHLIELIKKTELNAVVIDIKEVDGGIAFDTDSPLINDLGTENVLIPDIKGLIKKLHQENIYVIARIVVFKDALFSNLKPELALKTSSGKPWHDWRGKTWLDPASKEVWDYHIEIAREAIKVGFDEINFDYIRFPSDGDISKIIYPVWDNKTPKPEIIRQFFEYLNKELKPLGVFLSVDLFGLTMVREDDMNIGQILENAIPYFDFVCPMVYPSHYPPDFEGYKNPADYPYEIIKMNLSRGKERINDAKAMPTGKQAKL